MKLYIFCSSNEYPTRVKKSDEDNMNEIKSQTEVVNCIRKEQLSLVTSREGEN